MGETMVDMRQQWLDEIKKNPRAYVMYVNMIIEEIIKERKQYPFKPL